MFIDFVKIEVIAGNGGPGSVSFHREKFITKGGPNGGDGGRGGDVIAVADPHLNTLLELRYKKKYRAKNGDPGSGGMKTGRSADNVEIRVPVGTLIKDLESDQQLADLDTAGDRIVLAQGGKGGLGNTHFKSPINQAPRYAQPGIPGERRKLSLELKLLADVGLVGQPNAGKSTILATFSAARPKIADYPFTTLIPNLGIVKLREYKSCVMADIPGLIRGASDGKGLGHQFLKHVQRTRLLVYVVDINEPAIENTVAELRDELAAFDTTLPERPSIYVVTKIDTVSGSDLKDISKKLGKGYLYLSAVSRKGGPEFLQVIEEKLDQL